MHVILMALTNAPGPGDQDYHISRETAEQIHQEIGPAGVPISIKQLQCQLDIYLK